MADRDTILAALDETDRFVMIPRAVLRLLGPRDAAVLCWIRHRSRGGDRWVEETVSQLADDLGLSADQMRRALAVLREADLIESEESDRFSRKRRYRVTRRRGSATSDGADLPRPDDAESRRLPLENEKKLEKKETPAAGGEAESLDGWLREWWKLQNPRPTQSFVAIRTVARAAERAGWNRETLGRALTEVPVISTGALDLWRNRQKPAAKASTRYAPGSDLHRGATDRTGESHAW